MISDQGTYSKAYAYANDEREKKENGSLSFEKLFLVNDQSKLKSAESALS